MTEANVKVKPTKKAPAKKSPKPTKSEAPASGPVWSTAPQIQKLFETGKREGSLNSEEITSALNKAVESLNLDSASDDFETLIGLLGAQGH